MSSPKPDPRVGVAALVRAPHGGLVFGRRKGSHGAGKWAFPGGHLEHGENFFECAERETLEETGLRVQGRKVLTVTNDVFEDVGKHYITIFVVCEVIDPKQQPQIMEPDKCEEWVWRTFDEIRRMSPQELFVPIQNLLKQSSILEASGL